MSRAVTGLAIWALFIWGAVMPRCGKNSQSLAMDVDVALLTSYQWAKV